MKRRRQKTEDREHRTSNAQLRTSNEEAKAEDREQHDPPMRIFVVGITRRRDTSDGSRRGCPQRGRRAVRGDSWWHQACTGTGPSDQAAELGSQWRRVPQLRHPPSPRTARLPRWSVPVPCITLADNGTHVAPPSELWPPSAFPVDVRLPLPFSHSVLAVRPPHSALDVRRSMFSVP
jgi:hypothetical protein